MINQLKYRFIQPEPTILRTNTEKGLIANGIESYSNMIIFPGNADYKLHQDKSLVWPRELQTNFDKDKYFTVSPNSDGHLNPIYTLLDSLHYKEGTNLQLLPTILLILILI